MGVQMQRTMDYTSMVDLFVRSGLEIHPDDPAPEGLLTCFELADRETGKRYGAAGLVYDKETYILRCVAVEEECRGLGYGKWLVGAVMKEAADRGAEKIWLTAKVPKFYKKFGFEVVPMEEAPFETKCRTCQQYRNGCESEVMVFEY